MSTRQRRVGRRDYIQRPSRVCRKTYAERSVGVRRKAPGAHAETEEISTGCGASGGVTKLKEARQGDAPRPSRRVGKSLTLRMTALSVILKRAALKNPVRREGIFWKHGVLRTGSFASLRMTGTGGVSLALRMTVFFLSF